MIHMEIGNQNLELSGESSFMKTKEISYKDIDNEIKMFKCPEDYEVMIEDNENELFLRITVYRNGTLDDFQIDIDAFCKNQRENMKELAMCYVKLFLEQREKKLI